MKWKLKKMKIAFRFIWVYFTDSHFRSHTRLMHTLESYESLKKRHQLTVGDWDMKTFKVEDEDEKSSFKSMYGRGVDFGFKTIDRPVTKHDLLS